MMYELELKNEVNYKDNTYDLYCVTFEVACLGETSTPTSGVTDPIGYVVADDAELNKTLSDSAKVQLQGYGATIDKKLEKVVAQIHKANPTGDGDGTMVEWGDLLKYKIEVTNQQPSTITLNKEDMMLVIE